MSRSILLVALAGYAVALAVLVTFAAGQIVRCPRLSNADGVKMGMTRAEVHEAVGGPPGEYFKMGMTRAEVHEAVGGPPGEYFHPEGFPPLVSGRVIFLTEDSWVFDDGVLVVGFSDDGIVETVTVLSLRRRPFPNGWDHFWDRASAGPGAWFKR